MTGVQKAKRMVKVGDREVGKAADIAERKFRRASNIILRNVQRGDLDALDTLPHKPASIDYSIS